MYYTTEKNNVSLWDLETINNLLEDKRIKAAIDFLEDQITVNDHFKLQIKNYTRKYYEGIDTTPLATQGIVFLKFAEKALGAIYITENDEGLKDVYVDLEYLQTSDQHDVLRKKIVSFKNGEKDVEFDNPYDGKELELPELPTTEDFNTKVISCFDGGCCKLDGVQYKWCGSGCGSGTPVNSLDTCCRTHDYCYRNFSSMEDRCDCDARLITCAQNTNISAKSSVIAAFRIKMLRCPFA